MAKKILRSSDKVAEIDSKLRSEIRKDKENTDVQSNYTAILLCAGKGTRLAPIRGETPKPLFKVKGKELLRYSIDLMDRSIVDELVFVIDYKAEEIKSWVNLANLPYTIKFSQTSDLSIPEEVKLAFKQIKSDRSIICSTDEIRINFKLKEAVQFHESHNLLATMVVTITDKLYKHRVIEIDKDEKIILITDKPEYISNPDKKGLVNTGLLIMKREALDHFDLKDTKGSYGITKPLIKMRQLKAYIKEDIRYLNVNTAEEVSEAEKIK